MVVDKTRTKWNSRIKRILIMIFSELSLSLSLFFGINGDYLFQKPNKKKKYSVKFGWINNFKVSIQTEIHKNKHHKASKKWRQILHHHSEIQTNKQKKVHFFPAFFYGNCRKTGGERKKFPNVFQMKWWWWWCWLWFDDYKTMLLLMMMMMNFEIFTYTERERKRFITINLKVSLAMLFFPWKKATTKKKTLILFTKIQNRSENSDSVSKKKLIHSCVILKWNDFVFVNPMKKNTEQESFII